MRLRRIALAAVLSVTIAGMAAATPPAVSPAAAGPAPPDIVLILTDDQRWDTLELMPALRYHLIAQGVTFENAFVVNPLCCPSRATILSGQYSHTNGVYTNAGATGANAFDDSSTIATWLDGAGYTTMLAGKYLNRYRGRTIPPGWDKWNVLYAGGDNPGPYLNYSMNINGRKMRFGSDPRDYSTDVLARRSVNFIERTEGPLFLYFAPVAPHRPAKPAPRHRGTLSGLSPWRPPNFNESDVSDKPQWLQNVPSLTPSEIRDLDTLRRKQLETLLAVDEAVREIVRALHRAGRLDNTLIIFTSDNGLFWGEHRLERKYFAYEESARVPLIIRYDPLTFPPSEPDELVANVDLAATIADFAGAAAPGAEGMSLRPFLEGTPSPPWRSHLLIEHLDSESSLDEEDATYCAVRSQGYLYVLYESGEEELYDLSADPFQLDNVAEAPGYAGVLATHRTALRQSCNPPPPGLIVPY